MQIEIVKTIRRRTHRFPSFAVYAEREKRREEGRKERKKGRREEEAVGTNDLLQSLDKDLVSVCRLLSAADALSFLTCITRLMPLTRRPVVAQFAQNEKRAGEPFLPCNHASVIQKMYIPIISLGIKSLFHS